MSNTNFYTLITGAGSGLGKEFAVQCARQQRNLILIALPGSNLHSMAQQLMNLFDIDVRVFEFDMTDTSVLSETMQLISEQYKLDLLINNAGMGGTRPILSSSLEVIDKTMQLNMRSTVLVTRLLLPSLLRNSSHVINIASIAAFTPIAYKTVYPATKAFISSFSLGLREELVKSSVSVSVACPGPMMTNADTCERILLQGFKARISLLSTTQIVSIILKQAFMKRAVIVPGFWNNFNQYILNFIPTLLKTRIVSRGVQKELLLRA